MKIKFIKIILSVFLLLQFTIPINAVTYSYDDLNRLTTVTYDGNNSITYEYDSAGNILQIISTGQRQNSTYEITFGDLTGVTVTAGDPIGTTLPVTLAATTVGQSGYDSVIINVSVSGPGTAQLLAIDSNDNEFDVAQIGYWGPPSGFPIANDYDVTTDFTGKFSAAGTYTITAELYDLAADQAITSSTLTVDVTEVPAISTYAITFGDLTGVTVTTGNPGGTTLPVTLAATTVGQSGYDSVIINVSVSGPGTVQLLATDSNGIEFDVAQIGYWGPPSGFPIANDYDVTTDFTGKFSAAGAYTITAELYDLTASQVITSSTLTVEVIAVPAISTYAITFGDLTGVTITAGDPVGTTLPATLAATAVGQSGYDNVIINVSVSGPGTAQLLATDSNDNEFDVAQIGYWGPPSGFPIANDYDVTTDFTGKFSAAGTYTITAELYDLLEDEPITTSILNVQVSD